MWTSKPSKGVSFKKHFVVEKLKDTCGSNRFLVDLRLLNIVLSSLIKVLSPSISRQTLNNKKDKSQRSH